jgi:hypothetical protein
MCTRVATLARCLGSWCLRRLLKSKVPTGNAVDSGLCKIVKLSCMKDRWRTVIVPDIGAVMLPVRNKIKRARKVLRCRGGVAAQALLRTHIATGPVYSTDFGLPYALVQEETGVKRLYQKEDDIAPLLQLSAAGSNE